MKSIRSIRQEFARFIVAGALNTLGTYFLYLILLRVMGYRTAYSISFLVGIFTSYYLMAIFTFQRKTNWRGMVRYPIVYIFQYFLGIFLLYILVERLSL